MLGNSMRNQQVENLMVQQMLSNLKIIYKNKSGDEYKMAGDITKSPAYESIEKMISDLKTIKGYPKHEATDISSMFSTLHKPVFKEAVTEYMNEPKERNSLYTAMFTVGYRVLIGELARIYACTEMSDKGTLTYKPDRIQRRADVAAFIRSFDKSLNKKIDEYIASKSQREDHGSNYFKEYMVYLEANENGNDNQPSMGEVVRAGIESVARMFSNGVKSIFRGIKQLNPVSFINAHLMRKFQNDVDLYHNIASTYEATKAAYEEYMNKPSSKRDPKVVQNYVNNIKKYNMMMENQAAKIKDYDQRAAVEAEREQQNVPSTKPTTSTKAPSSSENGNDTSNDEDDDLGF